MQGVERGKLVDGEKGQPGVVVGERGQLAFSYAYLLFKETEAQASKQALLYSICCANTTVHREHSSLAHTFGDQDWERPRT